MDYPFVSIIIPTYNSASTLCKTIEACLVQGYPKDKLEIIVVDDGSKDNTKEMIKNFNITYIYQERQGPAGARNNGWMNSKGDAICFIDADCVPYRDWVSKLVQHYDRKDIGAVAGSYAVDGSPYLLDKFVHYEIKYRHSMLSDYVNSFGTYNVLVKRAVLEALNGFDPVYRTASGEDSDLSYRIIKAGYKIYFERGALVSHCNILRFWKYIMVQFRHSYWRMKLYKKNMGMVTKDKYGYWKDFLEVFLLMALILVFLSGLEGRFAIGGSLAFFLFIIQLLLPIKIFLNEKDIRYLAFSFVTFIRAFVRLIGGVVGFVVFWICREF